MKDKQAATRGPRSANPLASEVRAAEQAGYALPPGDDLRRLVEELREKILGEGYPCVGARSAFNRRNYRVGLYAGLGSPNAALVLCHDLYEFCREFPKVGDDFVTFIAGFTDSEIDSEAHYEQLIWRQLQLMHEIDRRHFGWDSSVSADPADPQFSFSIGGRAFFIVGLNPRASRKSRTTTRPILVFNLHEQFERLRARGKFEKFMKMIRARDIAYQGNLNPMLKVFGESSEARQYSGRAVPDDWVCPFHRKDKDGG